MEYFLYILHAASADKFYVGISSDPIRRLEFHNAVEKGFTSKYRPWVLVWTQAFSNRIEAGKAERKIKAWKSSVMIQKVISGAITL